MILSRRLLAGASLSAILLAAGPALALQQGTPNANGIGGLAIGNALSELVTAGSQAAARANLGLGSLATLSTLSGVDASGAMALPTGAVTPRLVADQFGDGANILAYKSVVDADYTMAFTRAYLTGKRVIVPPGTYPVCNVGFPSNSETHGMGQKISSVKLTPGCNGDVFVAGGAYSLFGTNSSAGANGFGFGDLTIDGNSANQTATGTAIDAVNGIAVYGAAWRLENVLIKNVLGHGIRSEWYQYGENPGGVEATLRNVTIDTVGRNGWWFKGPHDTNAYKVVVIDAGQEADNTFMGLRAEGYVSGQFFDFHGWHRSAATNRVAYQAYSTGGLEFVNGQFEGGRSQFYDGGNNKVSNSAFYAQSGAAGSALIVAAGSGSIFSGNSYTGKPGSAFYAFQFGTSSKGATLNAVNGGYFLNFDQATPFNYLYSLGYNSVLASTGYVATCPTQTFGGTRQSTDLLQFTEVVPTSQVASGVCINAQPAQQTVFQTADGTVANGNTRGAGAFDGQVQRYQANQVAGGYASALVGGIANLIGSSGNYTGGVAGNQNVLNGPQEGAVGGAFHVLTGNGSGIVGGQYAADRGRYGLQPYASGRFLATGDAQLASQVLRGTGATATAIRLTADGAAAGSANVANIPAQSAYALDFKLIVLDYTTPANIYIAEWQGHALTRAGAQSTTLLDGATANVAPDKSRATNSWAPSVSVTPDTNIGGLNISVTPPAGNTDTIHAVVCFGGGLCEVQ